MLYNSNINVKSLESADTETKRIIKAYKKGQGCIIMTHPIGRIRVRTGEVFVLGRKPFP